ncbi:hypothetical protein [Paenibacillus sp. YN15]|uniref:hypothetical protein n=1 Tax=Paenibacillus sp. YN15 TaxID=1742774 RepID=UPI000DCDB50E|nr:hypothetical protein [Paenibacillus sp. YN15]RAU91546.1 hypothetical protein DQG13_29300 [Paenibacillus sp. YN15]
MTKKLILVLVGLILAPTIALAAVTVNVNNYFFAHTANPGTYYLHLRSGDTTMWGDFVQHDAKVLQVDFERHLLSSDKLYAEYPDGSEELITGSSYTVKPLNWWIKLKLVKSAAGESYVRVTHMQADDQRAGDIVDYYFLDNTPTQYGDLTPTPTPTPTPTTEPTPTGGGNQSPGPTESPGTGGGEGCTSCETITNLLACPEWDTYMGEWTDAIKAALPPPPDWNHIADLIGTATIDHLGNYLGVVPASPSQQQLNQQITVDLPTMDSGSSAASSLVPIVPAGYEQPKPFDITSGPQIEIKDESKPFEIFDPLSNMQYDDPGVPVLPGSTSNSNGGITPPGKVDIPEAMPSKTAPPGNNDPVPIPSANPGTMPVPGQAGGPIPVPGNVGGEIPIPRREI